MNQRAVFVGLYEEYVDFVRRFGCDNIPYVKTDTALDLAEVINGHHNFVGNGSLAASIALGLGLNTHYEFCAQACHYMFKRDNIRIF